MKRILITGSRTWVDADFIHHQMLTAMAYLRDQAVFIHGSCPRGADATAHNFAVNRFLPVEPHPANWDRYGNRAGFVRNAEMVAAGADLCLAFIMDGSKGANHTATIARQAGIEVWRFERSTDGHH